MKSTPSQRFNLTDDESLVCALRWRRPRLISSLLIGFVCAAILALLACFLGPVALVASFGCLVIAIYYLAELLRCNRRLEELER